jgi:signal transduction histidine kinase
MVSAISSPTRLKDEGGTLNAEGLCPMAGGVRVMRWSFAGRLFSVQLKDEGGTLNAEGLCPMAGGVRAMRWSFAGRLFNVQRSAFSVSMRKPRLFWVMVLAFVLAIVLGVCGMLGFVGLALIGGVPAQNREVFEGAPGAYAEVLADYYLANGRSWEGVDRRLGSAPFAGPLSFMEYALADANGRIVSSSARDLPRGTLAPPRRLEEGVPLVARGERVGTLILARPARGSGWSAPSGSPPPFLRNIAAAGLGLTLVLGALAIVFAGWLNRPLRRLTAAAGELAGGRLDVQVPPARVRELDDLSQAFNRMARSLAAADRQRRQLTADVAHELRTPLTIIKGRLEGIQDGVYQANPDQVGRLLAETALLERLIEDLRVLALADAGQLPLFREPTDPVALLQRTAAAFAAQAEEQGVALHVAAPGDLPALDADPQRMAQVLANLVSNALRHTPAGGSVELRASFEFSVLSSQLPGGEALTQNSKLSTQNSVHLTVEDTGSGIAPEELPHIFERFWRADRARTRGSGGSGLGLAITRQIVSAHGGTIEAASELGKGTTITITLPAE